MGRKNDSFRMYIFVTKLISYAQEQIIKEKNNSQWVGCFESTVFIIKKLVSP